MENMEINSPVYQRKWNGKLYRNKVKTLNLTLWDKKGPNKRTNIAENLVSLRGVARELPDR